VIKNKNILISGGAGFVGFYLAKELFNNNKITIIDNLSKIKKKDRQLKLLLKSKNIKFYKKELTDIDPNKLSKNFDYIFDCAASVGVKKVIQNSFFSLKNNINITLKTIEIAKKQKKLTKIIFCSSSEVYDGGGKYYNVKYPTLENNPITMSDVFEKRTVYMASKILGEIMYINSGLPYVINRFHNIYGPRMGYSHVIPEIIKKLYSSKKKIEIYSPNHSRAFCYYKDAIEIILKLAISKKSKNKIFNVGIQKPEISIKKLAGIISSITNNNKKILFKKDNHNSPKRRCPSMKETYKITGKIKCTTIEEGVLQTFNYFKNHR